MVFSFDQDEGVISSSVDARIELQRHRPQWIDAAHLAKSPQFAVSQLVGCAHLQVHLQPFGGADCEATSFFAGWRPARPPRNR